MAKRQEKNLVTKAEEAKTFHDLIAVITADHKQTIRNLQSYLKTVKEADSLCCEKNIRHHKSQIKSLEARSQRYEKYQGNKKIPAGLRKQIAELETLILRRESSYDWRSFVRYRKQELAELFEKVERLTNPPKSLTTKNKAFKVGKEYTSQSITRAYDGHIWELLKGHFEQMPKVKGQRTAYKIVSALPEKTEYLELKERHFTKTLESLIDEAYGVVDELQSELQDAYDNMPDGLQGGPVGEARLEAALQLRDISDDQPNIPSCVSALRIVHYPMLRQSSRRDRAGAAADVLRVCAKATQTYRTSGAKLKKTEVKTLEEFSGQLEDHASEIDEVEFPGMFG